MGELFAICQVGQIEVREAKGFLVMRIESSGETEPWPGPTWSWPRTSAPIRTKRPRQ
jgi:hypothetical protein